MRLTAKCHCFAPIITLAACTAMYGQIGIVSGVVRDQDGKPLERATVTLSVPAQTAPKEENKSGPDGNYEFTNLSIGEYVIAVYSDGFGAPPARAVHVTAALPSPRVDFTLTRDAAAGGAGPHFEAAGVRGLIDPGGYSAPANAAAASGLIQGVADMQRDTKSSSDKAVEQPCSLAKAKNAIPQLTRAHETDPQNRTITRDLAAELIADEQFQAARDLLNAPGAARDQAEIHSLLARADEGLSMFAQAAEEYRAAALAEPSEDNLFGAGYEQILAGAPNKAVQEFQSGLDQHPASIKLQIGLATAESLEGRGATAVHVLLSATEKDRSDSRPYPFLVQAFVASNAEGERVRRTLKRFQESKPDDAQASLLYAVVLLNRKGGADAKDEASAESLLKRATELNPGLAQAHSRLGILCAAHNDLPCALHEFEAAARLSPEQADTHYRLAMAYKKAGHGPEAAKEFESFRRIKHDGDPKEANADAAIDMTQYVSVFKKPRDSDTTTVVCPGLQY